MFSKPCEGRVTSPFGYRIHPITNLRTMHFGVDYGNTPSTIQSLQQLLGKLLFLGLQMGTATQL